jgi:DtxR family transcriptional regulator, Mn-dependent transcriptional regulator
VNNGRVNHGHDLIDTSEMYLRTLFELEEEGVVPLRARIAERLDQSVPTVSQTVARMERDGLLTVTGDRSIQLTEHGRELAVRVMRKHRLAECLLVQIIGLDWELVHEEACRWEHVISEAVELKLLEILGHPTTSPYGNPIPGLDELGELPSTVKGGVTMSLSALPSEATSVVVRRIGEPIQSDPQLLIQFWRAGIRPNTSVPVKRVAGKLRIGRGDNAPELAEDIAAHVFVSP